MEIAYDTATGEIHSINAILDSGEAIESLLEFTAVHMGFPVNREWFSRLELDENGWVSGQVDGCDFCCISDVYGTEKEEDSLYYGVMKPQ